MPFGDGTQVKQLIVGGLRVRGKRLCCTQLQTIEAAVLPRPG